MDELAFIARIGVFARHGTRAILCDFTPSDTEWTRRCLTGYIAALPGQRLSMTTETERERAARSRLAMLPKES